MELPPEFWDEEAAKDLVGSIILIGFTYVDPTGAVEREQQIWGEIASADRRNGIAVMLRGNHEGETYVMPPDIRGIRPADPGVYTLRSTGEKVENPDYTAAWTIERPRQ